MKVINNYTSHLGLGETRVLPGEAIDLSKVPGYNENHPVVKWYIARGWLVVIGKGNGNGKPAPPVNVNTALNTGNTNDDSDGEDIDNETQGDDDIDDDAGDGQDGEKPLSELAKKNVNRLTLDELKTLAAEMELEVVEADTRNTLIEKIKATRNTGE